ncbi:peptidase C14, caspase domain-containing protein [Blastocladiella britannica]|nr:peptidase C14, caspase domain-containing protein [Blastocladiella britannica]
MTRHQNNRATEDDYEEEHEGSENEGSDNDYEDEETEVVGRRKAVFIGINYTGTDSELSGCHNDVINLSNFLFENYPEYTEENSIILMDTEDASPDMLPTKENMMSAMRWLTEDAQPDDQLFFHYSGHGASIDDEDGDEADGMDEALCPLDYEEAGLIVDDDVHAILADSLPAGAKLLALLDCCHSGTIVDLPYLYCTESDSLKVTAASRHVKRARTTRGEVIAISGCRDDQTSADAQIDDEATGAMSYALKRVLEENADQELSYADVLIKMRRVLRKGKYTQVPQLTAGRPVDMDDLFHI